MRLGIPLPTRHGWSLLFVALPLCLAGVLSIHATSASGQDASQQSMAALLTKDAIKQLVFVGVGLGAMMAVLVVGYPRAGRASYPLFAVCIALLACLVVDRWIDLPFVPVRRHARRWIWIGFTQIQPSELMKIAYVLALAWYLRYRRNYRTLGGLIMPFALTMVPMVLIKMQPDLGTVMLFLPVLFAMLFAAGAKARHLAVIIVMGLCCLPLFWFKIAPYQRLRIAGVLLQDQRLREYLHEPPTWLNGRARRWDYLRPAGADPAQWQHELDHWETNSGYQLTRSKTAIGSGGPSGRGWGRGIFVEYNFLPEKHNDFIFALIAHQWGLIGSLAVLLCYVAIVVIGFDVAARTQDPFGRLVAVGLAALIAVQALTNLCMTVGLGPITGVTLPFISAGGSSLIASFLAIGLLISVDQRRPILIARRPFEFDEEAEKYHAPSR